MPPQSDALPELHCYECGYDLRARPRVGGVCPECGFDVDESIWRQRVRQTRRARIRRWAIFFAILLGPALPWVIPIFRYPVGFVSASCVPQAFLGLVFALVAMVFVGLSMHEKLDFRVAMSLAALVAMVQIVGAIVWLFWLA